MRFVDLFAGLGGFHIALSELGHECVFSCEIDKELQALYKRNFDIEPAGDIRDVDASDIPPHEILCAGFPCQPFSKAGEQRGLHDPRWGNLFFDIIRIAKVHQPEFILIENVSNLEKHDEGRTWARMKMMLNEIGYEVKHKHLSPSQFGVPQVRTRMFVVAQRPRLNGFQFPSPLETGSSIQSILDSQEQSQHVKALPAHYIECLEVWQEFLNRFPKDEEIPSFPIWAMEFGATYPYTEGSPHGIGMSRLAQYRGSFGSPLEGIPANQVRKHLPHYAQTRETKFPAWKVDFIRKNRELYARHKEWIDEWLPKIQQFPHSFQKLEWNCKGGERNIWNYVLRFRPSGVRVRRTNAAPSLNTIDTQIPVIGWERRFMTMRECARLFGMGDIELPASITTTIRALGNAVNVEVVRRICVHLLHPEMIEPMSYQLELFPPSPIDEFSALNTY